MAQLVDYQKLPSGRYFGINFPMNHTILHQYVHTAHVLYCTLPVGGGEEESGEYGLENVTHWNVIMGVLCNS